MEPTNSSRNGPARASAAKRYGPLAAIVVIGVVIALVVALSGGSDEHAEVRRRLGERLQGHHRGVAHVHGRERGRRGLGSELRHQARHGQGPVDPRSTVRQAADRRQRRRHREGCDRRLDQGRGLPGRPGAEPAPGRDGARERRRRLAGHGPAGLRRLPEEPREDLQHVRTQARPRLLHGHREPERRDRGAQRRQGDRGHEAVRRARRGDPDPGLDRGDRGRRPDVPRELLAGSPGGNGQGECPVPHRHGTDAGAGRAPDLQVRHQPTQGQERRVRRRRGDGQEAGVRRRALQHGGQPARACVRGAARRPEERRREHRRRAGVHPRPRPRPGAGPDGDRQDEGRRCHHHHLHRRPADPRTT